TFNLPTTPKLQPLKTSVRVSNVSFQACVNLFGAIFQKFGALFFFFGVANGFRKSNRLRSSLPLPVADARRLRVAYDFQSSPLSPTSYDFG
ncbi:MAG: hypothetical protein IKD80_09515, partial [Selenomonadaceae bacterium]|nr:hypothetical protein [Selenomonadaceae bacterium]